MNFAVKPLLALCRVSNLPTVWMNVLTAVVLSATAANQTIAADVVLLLVLALSAFYCGGMSLNDLCDRRWDEEHQPFRPLPSGRVRVTVARRVTIALFAAGLALLALAPYGYGFSAGLALLAVIYLYDRFHKRYAATVLLMAAARLMVFVVSAAAVTGRIAHDVWTAGGLQFVYTLLITIAARYENNRGSRYPFPLIPGMIAGMSVLDGLILAVLAAPPWLAVGVIFALLTHIGQHHVRGD